MSKSVIACFYDEVGDSVVSYQIFPSYGDFYRSIVKAAFNKELPFSQFPADYTVSVIGLIDSKEFVPCNDSFYYSFADIQVAGKGMDANVNFNTRVFVERLMKGVVLNEQN